LALVTLGYRGSFCLGCGAAVPHPRVDWNRFALFASLSELNLLVSKVRALTKNVTITSRLVAFLLSILFLNIHIGETTIYDIDI
jgi:hypothetical protein